ncbi:hypothetical protein [Trueperella pecoris]|uniref:hypothetical protein n=1 Tax=Trueperella pecoris TaxID=2733571 RepID=UPI001ABDC4A3|nr:hypothetical protein [Trueperella pecoris]QTG76229.1 hypothetical protein J4179_04085 [Trueperella pecoris]
MAFLDLMRQLFNAVPHDVHDPSVVERAASLRERLSDDPNDVASFEQLAALINGAAVDRQPVDPLTSTDSSEGPDPDLILWALSEEIGGDSRAWYPLIQLARLAQAEDPQAARRYLETAADREDTGIALATGIRLLREAGQNEAAIELGLGRWNPDEQSTEVAMELVESALEAKKTPSARRFVEMLKEAGAGAELVDRLSVRIATVEEGK